MAKKKILHLITGLNIGGAEMMLLKMLPRLQDEFDNRVCCIMGHGPIGAKLEATGVPVTYLELRSPFDLVGTIFCFRKVVKEFQPNLLVTYLIHADLFGRIFGQLFGIKKIVCSQRGKLLQWEFLRAFDRRTAFLVTKYIVQTKIAQRELMQKLRLPAGRFSIIPNAIDLAEFNFPLDEERKKRELDIPQNHAILTCVSNLRRGKGHEYLLQAFEQLFQTHQDIILLIVGSGERMNELVDLVSDYSSKENIKFLGNRTDVKEILRVSDIFVLPTLGEGMSNAIMEAMASGLPIITTDIPENQALIQHQCNGILVSAKNSIEIIDSMKELLSEKKLKNQLGSAAQKKIRDTFSIEAVTKILAALYRSL